MTSIYTRFSPYLLATVMALSAATTAHAEQVLVDGTDTQAVLKVARRFGSVRFDKQALQWTSRTTQTKYQGAFVDCDDEQSACNTVRLRARFDDQVLPMECINQWNVQEDLAHAYLDEDGNAVLSMAVTLQRGITQDNLAANFDIWLTAVERFKDMQEAWSQEDAEGCGQ
jgi:hypothetical protein